MTAAEEGRWVSAWYAAPARMLAADIRGRTLRQIVHPHMGGDHIRLHFSNRYGPAPVELSSVSVASGLHGPLVDSDSRAVLFGGQTILVLQPGQEAVSDPVTFAVKTFSDVAVTWFLAAGDPVTGHFSGEQSTFLSGLGDVTAATGPGDFLHYPLQVRSSWLLTGMDVVASAPVNAVVAFGSSTTQGAGSSIWAHRSWPDQLSRRLWNLGDDRFMSVINAGIGGNQLTTAEPPVWMTAGSPPFMMGEPGGARLTWDALTQSGATDLIVNIGSNDLRNGVSSAMIIAAYRRLVATARTTFSRVFGSTIMPGGYPGVIEVEHRLVNTWLRTAGTSLFDAVFEFAIPLGTAQNEAALHPDFDSGDGIHPNDEGYRVVAEAVHISVLSGSPGH